MSKPKPPPPPDYAAAATSQGTANENSAIATNFLNQANQVGPNGSLTYTYGPGITLADGTNVPQATATTTLSPAQQKLLDQNNAIAASLNGLAQKGIGYVGDAVGHPIKASGFNPLTSGVPTSFQANRDQVTNAMMQRLQPYIDKDRAALDTRLANQGITQGSEAYGSDMDTFNKGVNDQRIAALLAGDNEEQGLFQRGLASSQFANSAQQQAIQEADYFQNQPLNMLNALRSGNQASIPQFGNVTAGSSIAPAPLYQATNDQYTAAMNSYQAKLAQENAMMSGVAGLGSAAIMASDRRLKKNIEYLYTRLDGLKVYAFDYILGKLRYIGVMADEVLKLRPDALGPSIAGFATVNYKVLRDE